MCHMRWPSPGECTCPGWFGVGGGGGGARPPTPHPPQTNPGRPTPTGWAGPVLATCLLSNRELPEFKRELLTVSLFVKSKGAIHSNHFFKDQEELKELMTLFKTNKE